MTSRRRLLALTAVALLVGSCSSESVVPILQPEPSAAFDPAELAEIVDEIVGDLQPTTVADALFTRASDGYVGGSVVLDLEATTSEFLTAEVEWTTWEPGVGALLLGQPFARDADTIEVSFTRECGYDVNGLEPLCAEGGFVELAFTEGHWSHVETVYTWIS
ncbi:MAG: hypothetical protein RLZ04_301 [Actinomycetota bacterium]|jgi:hypothetical protein